MCAEDAYCYFVDLLGLTDQLITDCHVDQLFKLAANFGAFRNWKNVKEEELAKKGG